MWVACAIKTPSFPLMAVLGPQPPPYYGDPSDLLYKAVTSGQRSLNRAISTETVNRPRGRGTDHDK